MVLKKLQINQFRNIQQAELRPDASINILVGCNGSGKTSILEAIHYLSLGRSFRTSQTHRVIQHQSRQFTLFAETQTPDTSQRLGLAKTRTGETEIKISGEKAKRLADLARQLPTQLIHPEGFNLVTGSPQHRRQFIDWGVFQTTPSFIDHWSRCKRLLQQRNSLLRQKSTPTALHIWDDEWIKYAQRITEMRRSYLDSFCQYAASIVQHFLPEYPLDFKFHYGWPAHTSLKQSLENQWLSDQQRGFTQCGPHKADLSIRVHQIPVHDCLSRGQLKLLVCALRLAQSLHLYAETGRCSILLIDDFAAELDQSRRHILAQQLLTAPFQVFLTAIHEKQLAEWTATPSLKVFHVKQGQINTGTQHTVE